MGGLPDIVQIDLQQMIIQMLKCGHLISQSGGRECDYDIRDYLQISLLHRQNEHCICSGHGLAMSSLYPEMRFSWEIKSVDALFCNGLTRLGDLSKEAILQAIKDGDLRFLQVSPETF